MKTTLVRMLIASVALMSMAVLSDRIYAKDPSAVKQKTYKGIIAAVGEKERTLVVDGFWSTRTFHLADSCQVSLENKASAAPKDLRPGYRVEINYTTHDGVRVANQVAQKNITYAGHISSIDPARRLLVVSHGANSKTFTLGDACQIVGRGDKSRTLTDLKVGQKVTVSYTSPGQANLACRVEDAAETFSGTIEAIDTTTGTLKAGHMLANRTFALAGDCRIVINGKPDAKLRDLCIGDKVSFNYENVSGVLLATRIEREMSASKPEASQLTRTGESGQ